MATITRVEKTHLTTQARDFLAKSMPKRRSIGGIVYEHRPYIKRTQGVAGKPQATTGMYEEEGSSKGQSGGQWKRQRVRKGLGGTALDREPCGVIKCTWGSTEVKTVGGFRSASRRQQVG